MGTRFLCCVSIQFVRRIARFAVAKTALIIDSGGFLVVFLVGCLLCLRSVLFAGQEFLLWLFSHTATMLNAANV